MAAPVLAARVLAMAAAAALLGGRPARAGGAPARPGAAPAENASYVPDDDDDVRRALAAADEAVAGKDWGSAVRALQRAAEGPRDAVVALEEAGVFESARTVAHHRVARLGAEGLAAYQRAFGAVAAVTVAAAVERLDERGLAEAADRYLPSEEGRRAVLALADLASERGDADAALGWLARLEDLEAVAGPGLEAERERWRASVAARRAAALARDEASAGRVRAALAADPMATPARADLRDAPEPRDWPTSGGSPSRARTAPAVGAPVALAWVEPLAARPLSRFTAHEPGRPSPWFPPRAVVLGDRVLVFDGDALHVRDLEGGRLRARIAVRERDAREDDDESFDAEDPDAGESARRRWGWIEGHALTARGSRAWCAVAPARSRFSSLAEEDGAPPAPGSPRAAHVAAVDLDAGRVLWRAGGASGEGDPLRHVRLHGAPCLYRGTLFVAGIRATQTKDQWEALLVALDPATGAVRFTAALGAGGPVRAGRDDEILPGSCAAARGRVHVLTALGIASAVDAETGRTLWSYRYDRGAPDGETRSRRLSSTQVDTTPRRSSFHNEPPIVGDGRCFLAPTDARTLVSTFDRPRGARRLLVAWKRSRTEGYLNLALEHLAGLTDGRDGVPPTLVGVGQGHRVEPTEVHACVVGMDPATGHVRWSRALPDGGPPEPHGRAAVTAKEVFVPTRAGIAGFRLGDGADLPFAETSSSEAHDAHGAIPGNLVVAPGRGLVSVNARVVARWKGPD